MFHKIIRRCGLVCNSTENVDFSNDAACNPTRDDNESKAWGWVSIYLEENSSCGQKIICCQYNSNSDCIWWTRMFHLAVKVKKLVHPPSTCEKFNYSDHDTTDEQNKIFTILHRVNSEVLYWSSRRYDSYSWKLWACECASICYFIALAMPTLRAHLSQTSYIWH
jgi:hypothetical protein